MLLSERCGCYPAKSGSVRNKRCGLPHAIAVVRRSECKSHRFGDGSKCLSPQDILFTIETCPSKHAGDNMAINDLPIPRDPTEEEALALFKAIEDKFPSKTLGDEKWYILTVS